MRNLNPVPRVVLEYSWYITPEQYEIAAQHHISKRTVDDRVRQLGWEVTRACTEPLHRQTLKEIITPELIQLLKERELDVYIFRRRVNRYGWSIADAMTIAKGAR